jgi:hypothetical protein
MKFKPGLAVADLSGSLGGLTASHNKGGRYFRVRSIPTNPNTAKQTNIRTILAELSAGWASTGPTAQAGWKAWAMQNPITNTLGDKVTLSGHQAYIQLNHRIRQAGDSVINDPPIGVAPSALLTLSAVGSEATSVITLTWTATPLAATERLWVFAALIYLRLVKISDKAQATGLTIGDEVEAIFGDLVQYQTLHLRCSVYESTTGLLSQPRAATCVIGA